MEMFVGTFGGRMLEGMIVQQVGRDAIAKRLGISRQHVGRMLKMKRPNIGAAHFIELCDLLKVRTRWLACGIGRIVPARHMEKVSA